jgi:hypothetical protein
LVISNLLRFDNSLKVLVKTETQIEIQGEAPLLKAGVTIEEVAPVELLCLGSHVS